MKYYLEFEVTGRGEFPWDMLRHSQLFPIYTEDAMNLPLADRKRTIKLGVYCKSTYIERSVIDRFASFLWAAELTLEERL